MAKKESIRDKAIKAILDGEISSFKLKSLLGGEGEKPTLNPKEKQEIYNSMKLEEAKKELVKLDDETFKAEIKKLQEEHTSYMSKLKRLEEARKKKAAKK